MADAARSPTCEIAPPAAPMTAKLKRLTPALPHLLTASAYSIPSRAAPTIPPIPPSTDFLGLKRGAILCLPINIPTQ